MFLARVARADVPGAVIDIVVGLEVRVAMGDAGLKGWSLACRTVAASAARSGARKFVGEDHPHDSTFGGGTQAQDAAGGQVHAVR